jgi:16S rRNA (cytosine967-C5)-methyltransferase
LNSARRIAYDVLFQSITGPHTLDYQLDAAEARIARLRAADRALTHALVYGTLRWQARLDYQIDRLARKPQKIDLRTRIILRIALFQMHHMDRVPDSALVHTAVELTREIGRTWDAGFVNGILRRAAAVRENIDWPDMQSAPEIALSVRHSFPRWLSARWIERFGPEQALRLCEAINTVPPITIRTNTLKTDRERLIEAIGAEIRRIDATAHSPEGIMLSGFNNPISEWNAFQNGWFQVQDEGAQMISHALSPEPGETIWDACAGLGTKSAHLAQLMHNQGAVLATDRHAFKLERLTREMQRLGITIAKTRCTDLTAGRVLSDLPRFDRILVDAPCSGLGVLRKNPDGKWKVSPDDLVSNHQRQLSILETTCRHLRSGGMLLYAVCSFEPEENEDVVKAFLQKHPEFAIQPVMMKPETRSEHLLTPEGWFRTYPHRHGMDGFFAAAMVKHR